MRKKQHMTLVEVPDKAEQKSASKAAIRDIAAHAGVSVATVSRVLNGRPDVSPATRERVLRHIRELGYVRNRNAHALAHGRTGFVGLVVPYMLGDFYARIVNGVADALYDRGLRLVMGATAHQRAREMSLLEQLMDGTTDGTLLVMPAESNAELAALQERGYPVVVIDPRFPVGEGVPSVAAANLAGGRAATEHLLSLGHRPIGVITGPAQECASVDRLGGYHAALLAAGLTVDPTLIEEGAFDVETGYQAALRLLAHPNRPTAIFAFNDDMATGVLRAARQYGLSVPEDLSVVGFDDNLLAAAALPALTTIRQPLQEIGRAGVDLLCRLLNGEPIEAMRTELSTRLIVRESTAPPRE